MRVAASQFNDYRQGVMELLIILLALNFKVFSITGILFQFDLINIYTRIFRVLISRLLKHMMNEHVCVCRDVDLWDIFRK